MFQKETKCNKKVLQSLLNDVKRKGRKKHDKRTDYI
nr:MAG TPA: hypothetical protein [Caudoviricetes sp.]